MKDPLLKVPTSIDILYLQGFFVAFVSFSFLRGPVLYIVFFVLGWSIYQDWRSARVAETRPHWYFLISDILTVLNYVSLFIALALPANPRLGYSDRIWLHWGLVFVIYIVWNLVMRSMDETDEASRTFFLKYSLVEVPIVLYCFGLYLDAQTGVLSSLFGIDLLAYPQALLLLMAGVHTFILFYWVYQTYLSSRVSV